MITPPPSIPEVRPPTFKERLSRTISTRFPEYATKFGRLIILGLVKLYRFIVSLIAEAFNR